MLQIIHSFYHIMWIPFNEKQPVNIKQCVKDSKEQSTKTARAHGY